MKRIALTDESGSWFDEESALGFDESTWWDGNNHISCATGSQWCHEALYYTASGNWVLNRWSAYQHVRETYEQIDQSDAIDWLIAQERMDDPDLQKLPESVRRSIHESISAAEL